MCLGTMPRREQMPGVIIQPRRELWAISDSILAGLNHEGCNSTKELKYPVIPSPCQSIFALLPHMPPSTLTRAAGMVKSFSTTKQPALIFYERISAMPHFLCKKPYHREIFSRQVGEIRNLLHVLEMREGLDEAENRPRMDMYETGEEFVLEFDL